MVICKANETCTREGGGPKSAVCMFAPQPRRGGIATLRSQQAPQMGVFQRPATVLSQK